MTSKLPRRGSFSAFTWQGKLPIDPHATSFANEFAAALACCRFRTIDQACSEETSVGWCSPEDPSGATFERDEMDVGPAMWLRMRIDVKKLPAAQLRMHLAAEERARGKALSPRERRDMKSDLLEKLMPRVLPTTRHIDALIFNDHRRAVLFAVSRSVREHFAKMFRGSFGIELEACGPRALARIRAGEGAHDAIDKLQPTKWPVARAGQ